MFTSRAVPAGPPVGVTAGGGGGGGGGGTKPVAFLCAPAFNSRTAMAINCPVLSRNAAADVSTALVASEKAAIIDGGKIDASAVMLALSAAFRIVVCWSSAPVTAWLLAVTAWLLAVPMTAWLLAVTAWLLAFPMTAWLLAVPIIPRVKDALAAWYCSPWLNGLIGGGGTCTSPPATPGGGGGITI